MKRILCALLCLCLLMGLSAPVFAEAEAYTNMKVRFTDDSRFEVGGTVTVDKYKMLDDGGIFAEQQEALLEGNVQYYWFRGEEYYADGSSITLKDADQGYTFYCQAALYSDADHTQQFGTLKSDSFTVPTLPLPEITTKSLKNGTVGESYYQKLECTNPDVTFGLLQSSLPDGLTLTQHGEIEGTPTKAGFWYVVVIVRDEFGVENTAEFEITIQEKQVETQAPTEAPTEETTEAPTEETTAETTEATEEATEETTPATTEETVPTVGAIDGDGPGNGWVLWVCFGALLVLIGTAVCVILIVAKKKKV